MKKIELLPGTDIIDAGAELVRSAPAYTDFNGVTIRARYATSRPSDIVRQWEASSMEAKTAFDRSPVGLRMAEDRLQRRVDAQRVVVDCVDELRRDPALFGVPGALLSWVERIAPAGAHSGVNYDRAEVVSIFAGHGWAVGANCDEQFDGDDARNFAGWIVGQWLAHGRAYPHHIEQWRTKFEGVDA